MAGSQRSFTCHCGDTGWVFKDRDFCIFFASVQFGSSFFVLIPKLRELHIADILHLYRKMSQQRCRFVDQWYRKYAVEPKLLKRHLVALGERNIPKVPHLRPSVYSCVYMELSRLRHSLQRIVTLKFKSLADKESYKLDLGTEVVTNQQSSRQSSYFSWGNPNKDIGAFVLLRTKRDNTEKNVRNSACCVYKVKTAVYCHSGNIILIIMFAFFFSFCNLIKMSKNPYFLSNVILLIRWVWLHFLYSQSIPNSTSVHICLYSKKPTSRQVTLRNESIINHWQIINIHRPSGLWSGLFRQIIMRKRTEIEELAVRRCFFDHKIARVRRTLGPSW